MEKAEIFSFPTIPGSGGRGQSLHNFEVLVKKIASSKLCPTLQSPT